MKRRRFVQFLAAGSAAALAGTAAGLADPIARLAEASSPDPEKAPPELAKELENQKEYLAKTLRTIREYPLPPGSDPAFTFAPRRARKRT
jgi:hypothetical protein